MMRFIDKRFVLAGALAGASSIAALALATVALLLIGLLWQYAFSSSIPVIRDTALGAVLADAGRIPSFLWSWRWALLATTALGTLLALGDRLAEPLPYAWRDGIVGAALVGVTGAVVGAALLATADQPLYDLGDQTGTLPELAERQPAAWNVLAVASLVTLAVAGTVWFLWAWWYARWRGWLRLGQNTAADPAVRPAEEWFALRQAQTRFRQRAALAGAAGLALNVAGVLWFQAVRADVRSGDVWARPESPNVAVPLSLGDGARQLVVENTFGDGSVEVAVLRAADQAPVTEPVLLEFAGERLGADRQTIDVATLPAGSYLLNAQLRGGQGGRAGYALLQSRPALVPVTAIVAGVGLGALMTAAALLASSLLRRSGTE